MKRKLLDVSISKKLGWKAKVSLKDGIKRTYKEYKKNMKINHPLSVDTWDKKRIFGDYKCAKK